MRTHSYRSEQDKADIVTLEIGYGDRAMMTNAATLVHEVRQELAKEIVKRIMVDLGPILDRMIAKYAEVDKEKLS